MVGYELIKQFEALNHDQQWYCIQFFLGGSTYHIDGWNTAKRHRDYEHAKYVASEWQLAVKAAQCYNGKRMNIERRMTPPHIPFVQFESEYDKMVTTPMLCSVRLDPVRRLEMEAQRQAYDGSVSPLSGLTEQDIDSAIIAQSYASLQRFIRGMLGSAEWAKRKPPAHEVNGFDEHQYGDGFVD